MSFMTKKRLLLSAGGFATVAAVGTLVAGTTLGLFSANEVSGSNSFTAGTVTVTTDTPASVTCAITNMVPGDSTAGAGIGNGSDTKCTYNVKYSGSANAWLGVDIAVANGGTSLYDGTATGLQLYLNDASSTNYVTSTAPTAGSTYRNTSNAATSLPTGTTSNLLVSTSAATTGTTVHLSLDYALPIASGNGYQGGSATVTLTFHAVQSGNNTPAGGTCNNAGEQCTSISWS